MQRGIVAQSGATATGATKVENKAAKALDAAYRKVLQNVCNEQHAKVAILAIVNQDGPSCAAWLPSWTDARAERVSRALEALREALMEP